MNRLIFKWMPLWCLLGISNFILAASPYINTLNLCEVTSIKTRMAPQIMLGFAQPFYVERKIEKNKELLRLELAFPGMNIKDFRENDVVGKISKEMKGLVKKVELDKKDVPSPRVILVITFSRSDILLRWCKIDEEPVNRLILDIFYKKTLEDLKKKGANLLYTNNDFLKNDSTFLPSKNIPEMRDLIILGTPGPLVKNKRVHIVVDAGHGGTEPGAVNNFFLLKEKDVALDIALRAKNLLKKNGFRVSLTRNCDKNLTLLERNELAGQLKADLFVSIHANSAPSKDIDGIETYSLNSDGLLPEERTGGFLFVFSENDKILSKLADNLMLSNINLSRSLASSIQSGLTDFLNNRKLSVVDRGVKKAKFRVLLRSEIPVALIEVGFLTNRREALRLSNSKYRHLLAEGITRGIQNYLSAIN